VEEIYVPICDLLEREDSVPNKECRKIKILHRCCGEETCGEFVPY